MNKSEFTEYELNEIKQHELELQDREELINEYIEQYGLKSKSREYLEHEVASLRLELKRVEDAPQLEFERAFNLLKLGFKSTGIFARVSKVLGGSGKNSEKNDAIAKAERLWEEALESGEVVRGDKERFIEKIQKEHPDIAKLSFEHLSKNVLKYPKK